MSLGRGVGALQARTGARKASTVRYGLLRQAPTYEALSLSSPLPTSYLPTPGGSCEEMNTACLAAPGQSAVVRATAADRRGPG